MKTGILFITIVLIFAGCKKEDEILNDPEIEGVYISYHKSMYYSYNDSLYYEEYKLDPNANVGWGSVFFAIEQYNGGFRAFPVGAWAFINGGSDKFEKVNPRHVSYFKIGEVYENKIFIKSLVQIYATTIFSDDSLVLEFTKPYPVILSRFKYALVGTMKDSAYVKVGTKPPGIPKPDIYAWVFQTYDVVCEKYSTLDEWKREQIPYKIE